VFVKYTLTHEVSIHTILQSDNKCKKKICLHEKVPAKKNASHPLKIHTEPSSDDNDFVHSPPKRNRGPEHEPGNIPRHPPRPTATQPDREALVNKTYKVM
jgi:hypothetical protein